MSRDGGHGVLRDQEVLPVGDQSWTWACARPCSRRSPPPRCRPPGAASPAAAGPSVGDPGDPCSRPATRPASRPPPGRSSAGSASRARCRRSRCRFPPSEACTAIREPSGDTRGSIKVCVGCRDARPPSPGGRPTAAGALVALLPAGRRGSRPGRARSGRPAPCRSRRARPRERGAASGSVASSKGDRQQRGTARRTRCRPSPRRPPAAPAGSAPAARPCRQPLHHDRGVVDGAPARLGHRQQDRRPPGSPCGHRTRSRAPRCGRGSACAGPPPAGIRSSSPGRVRARAACTGCASPGSPGALAERRCGASVSFTDGPSRRSYLPQQLVAPDEGDPGAVRREEGRCRGPPQRAASSRSRALTWICPFAT